MKDLVIDTVLVNPNNRTPAPFAAIEPPLWLGLIAGYHAALGESVAIVDAEMENLTIAETAIRVNSLSPRETIIVVMGNNPSVSSTPKMAVAQELQRFIKAKLTGLHPIAVGHRKAISHPFSGFPQVPWELLPPLGKYRAHNWHCLQDLEKREGYAVLYTSLNCPSNCFFCNVHALYGDRTMRLRPMGDVCLELDLFARFGVKNIKIWDELFCLYETRVNHICDWIIAQGYDFNIWAYARVDTVTDGVLSKMKRAGFNWLAYGFESANHDVRLRAQKAFSDSKAQWAIDLTREAGINIIANFMFGLPGETEDDMKANLDMAMRQNFEYVNFSVALPYPGSPWYDSLAEKPTDWARFSQFHPNMYGDPRVVKFRDDAFHTYFSRPEYLSMIRAKFGEKAERHIKEMERWHIG